MTRQALRRGSGQAFRPASGRGSGQAIKGPSVTRDLLMLGDIYLTLAWMAFQRLRYGSIRPREARRGAFEAPVATMLRPHEADEEGADTATRRRG